MASKSGKKSFVKDLSQALAYQILEDNLRDDTSTLLPETPNPSKPEEKPTTKTKKTKTPTTKTETSNNKPNKKNNKSFQASLEAFMNQSIEDNPPQGPQAKRKEQLQNQAQKSSLQSMGLDLLLQNTLGQDLYEQHNNEPSTKRLTVVLEEDKIEKLKQIARKRKLALRDLVEELVESFLASKLD